MLFKEYHVRFLIIESSFCTSLFAVLSAFFSELLIFFFIHSFFSYFSYKNSNLFLEICTEQTYLRKKFHDKITNTERIIFSKISLKYYLSTFIL